MNHGSGIFLTPPDCSANAGAGLGVGRRRLLGLGLGVLGGGGVLVVEGHQLLLWERGEVAKTGCAEVQPWVRWVGVEGWSWTSIFYREEEGGEKVPWRGESDGESCGVGMG